MPPPDPKTLADGLTLDATTIKITGASGVAHSAFAATMTPLPPFGPVDAQPPSQDDGAFTSRYEARELLGEGGMGEVRLCKDKRIGRDVAVKVIRPGHGSRSDLRMRFVREARVQGQLEHPSIVPVYDLGLTPEPAFFTMKRVRGVTLEEVIDRLRVNDADAAARHSRRKLLTAFGSVCLAVDFAHAHGVVHRDLKPANVMLGDFGEVYVLDWGVAKVGDAADVEADLALEQAGESNAKTAAGALMGTLGYMAPEQLRGGAIDGRADVYALGAILFELLALTPLHAGAKASDVIQSTLEGADARPSARASHRDVPPELETICVKATALDADARFLSARELHHAVEGFLDGDRDLELRRAMAQSHAGAAAEAAARAMSDLPTAASERSLAMREVGRALALDPGNQAALRTMVELLLEPPRHVPPEAQAALDEAQTRMLKHAGRAALFAYLSWWLYLPLMLWMGVLDWTTAAFSFGLITLSAVFARGAWRRPYGGIATLAVSSLAIGLIGRQFGPSMFIPAILVGNTMPFALEASRTRRIIAIALGCAPVIALTALEGSGVIAPSYVFRDGALTIVPHMIAMPALPTTIFLALGALATVVTSSLYLGRVGVALSNAEKSLQLYAWQLRQLMPKEVHSAVQGRAPQDSSLTCEAT